MKQSIQLRLGQHLTMTPQLQQAIRLLQLSTLELHQEIQEALDTNLMLESAEDGELTTQPAGEPRSDPGPLAEGMNPTRAEGGDEERRDLDLDAGGEMTIPTELPVDSDWSDHFDGYTGGGGGEEGDFDPLTQQSRPETLQDFLHWQLNLCRLDSTERAIATAIVDAIDADGYLTQSCEELREALGEEGLTVQEIETVLHRIQALDPPGVGARDLAECLLIQLRQQSDPSPATRDAKTKKKNKS